MSHNSRASAHKVVPRQLLRLLLAAAVCHLVLVVTISLLGRTHTLPQTFDQWGVGTSFAVDSSSYRKEAEAMAQLIQQGRFRDWWNYGWFRSGSHIRPYSIAFALLGKLLGYSMLAAEPVNLCYYLVILTLTYAIGAEVFDRRVGLYAATAVALWPSLLLYTTQMLRDPLATAAILLLVLGLSFCIRRSLSPQQAGAVTAMGTIAALSIWLCKAESWEIVYLILFLAIAFCLFGQIKERRFEPGKTLALAAILLVVFGLPRALPTMRLADMPDYETQVKPGNAGSEGFTSPQRQADGSQPPWERLAWQIGYLRHRFVFRYPAAGSNIDAGVDLRGTGDVLRYFPRAVEIGFFAPFPKMWFARGAQVGLGGRLVTGAETLVMYSIIALMLIALLRRWDNLLMWFLFATSAAGCVALGYVVVNISSLYRMRYPFFILVIILGAGGAVTTWERVTGRSVKLKM